MKPNNENVIEGINKLINKHFDKVFRFGVNVGNGRFKGRKLKAPTLEQKVQAKNKHNKRLFRNALNILVQKKCEEYLDGFFEWCKQKELRPNNTAGMRSIFDFETLYLKQYKTQKREEVQD